MPESLNALWRNASPLKRLLLAGVPAVILALGAVGVGYAVFSGGGSSKPKAEAVVPSPAPATATAAPKPTQPPPTVAPTASPTPASAGLQATNGGGGAPTGGGTSPDYNNVQGGGTGAAPPAPDVPSGGAQRADDGELTGPGPAEGTNWTLVIPSIGVNASVESRTVGSDGTMGNPTGAFAVMWYDFSQSWVGVGGVPGQPGANAVFAGHVDYIHVGPAVFWSIRDLQPGDIVTAYTDHGSFNYSVQWGQWADPEADFSAYVGQTGQESITLVTCIGSFSGGHYSNRYIVRGVRV